MNWKLVDKWREEAYAEAQTMSDDADDILGFEADIFEAKLGNYLIDNPKFFARFKRDEGYREDMEDLIGVDWDDFLRNVEASMA